MCLHKVYEENLYLFYLLQCVSTYFLYTFQLLFAICAVVLAMLLRPVILRMLWNFE